MRSPYFVLAPVVALAGLFITPTATAECTTSGNTTICSFGEGGNSGPSVPYPCQYDYYCDDSYGWEFDLDMDPGSGIGLPGSPGDRPGGGGGGGGRPGGGGR
ncbi:MAG: hypothetical protein ACXWZL_10055 [Mycobacterium sp.]